MKLHLTLLTVALTLSTALSSVACGQCNDVGCAGCFGWTLDGAELFGVGYDVEYERDHDYRGDPSCGYCDESQERSFAW